MPSNQTSGHGPGARRAWVAAMQTLRSRRFSDTQKQARVCARASDTLGEVMASKEISLNEAKDAMTDIRTRMKALQFKIGR